jgi:hypothetical protein
MLSIKDNMALYNMSIMVRLGNMSKYQYNKQFKAIISL